MYRHNCGVIRKLDNVMLFQVDNEVNTMSDVKERMIEVIQEQPEDSSYEEILKELAFEQMVDRGLRDSREGKTAVTGTGEKCCPHKKQLLTYLRRTNMKLDFLLNFGEGLMKNGITRTVNGLPE